MSLILSLILTMAFIMIYMLMIQIFTVLFRITGLTKEKARFQVISLLTNSGFTTSESELIVQNRSRRKIAKYTMITGTIFNVLIVSLLINILFNLKLNDEGTVQLLVIAILSFIGLILIIRLPFFRNGLEKLIEKIATRINDKKHHENIITELDSYGQKSVVEVYISKLPNVIKGKNIEQAALRSRYNIILLLIQRNGRLIDVKRDTIIQKGDRVVMFGKTAYIKELFDVQTETVEPIKDESNLNTISIIDNYGSNAMAEIEVKVVPRILYNRTLGQSILKEEFDINVLMTKRNNKVILVDAYSKIEQGDTIIVFGPYQHIKTIFNIEE